MKDSRELKPMTEEDEGLPRSLFRCVPCHAWLSLGYSRITIGSYWDAVDARSTCREPDKPRVKFSVPIVHAD